MKDCNICVKMEKEEIALFKYAAGWENKTMSAVVSNNIRKWLSDWKEREPEKYNFWREQYDKRSDHKPELQPGSSPERETASSR